MVTFYEAVARREGGSLVRPDPPYDLDAVLRHIRSIDPADRLVQQRDMDLDSEVITQEHGEVLIVLRERGEGGPAIKQRGQEGRRAISLGENEYLAEETHVMFFPRSVVGVMRAQGSATHTRVANYLNATVQLDPPLALAAILARDIQERLRRADQTYWAEIKLPAQSAGLLQQGGGRWIGDSLDAISRGYGDATVSLRIAIPKKGHQREGDQLLEDFQRMVLDDGAPAEKAKVKVRPEEGPSEAIDLLSEKLSRQVDVDVRTDDPQRLDDASAVRGLRAAYEYLEEDITAALEHPRWLSP